MSSRAAGKKVADTFGRPLKREALKLKTACSFVKRTGNDRFELRNEKTPELTFLVFKVL
jgi:hypothetical protein